jgi:rhodanese-related sulfurtransferase
MNPLFIEPELFNQMLLDKKIAEMSIIDVREEGEWDYYHLEEAVHFPMNTIPERLNDLSKDQTLYIICAHGVRSAAVCQYLFQHGFSNVTNVEGGMAAVAELRGFAYD